MRCAYLCDRITIGPREVTGLGRLSRKICPACGIVSCRRTRTIRARLLGHGIRAEKEQLVLYGRSADASPKVVQVVFGLRRATGVVHPAIRVQRGTPMVFEKAPVERVAPAASHEINLEIRLSKPRVGVELVGLDGHLLHVLDARLDKRLRSAAELHSAGCRNNAVNVVTRGGQRHPIPCRIAPVTNGARNDPGQLRDVAADNWQIFDLP